MKYHVWLTLLMAMNTTVSWAQEIPLVDDVEHIGAKFPTADMPEIDQLPIIRPLPDPFEWSDKSGRSTEFKDWSHRSSEIEHYGIGRKRIRPESVDANFKDGTLTVNVTQSGETLVLAASVQLPDGVGPFPPMIGIGQGSGSLPNENLADRKIATIAFKFNQLMSHTQKRSSEPFNRLYPQQASIGASSAESESSLKRAVGTRFKIGVGVSHQVVQDPLNADLIRKHFQIITPENCMKPQGIHPEENRWNFEATDQFVDFAQKNSLEVVGHCLVWAKDDRTDQWMMEENGKAVSREKLLSRIETHINTVANRYGDAVSMWDVVNEAIGDSSEGLLRDSVYSRTTGMEFIATAFKTARAADPDALLIYNDYNGHKPGKREKLIELLTRLKAAGAPVDAYGMQGHFELGDDSLAELRATFDALRKLDVKVVVSELDIDVVKRGRWWADGGKYRDELKEFDPYKDGFPPEIEKQMSDQYVKLFELFDEYRDVIARVSFWNLHDGESWLNHFPWNRTNYPLLFDRKRQPKPAFDAVIGLLQRNDSK